MERGAHAVVQLVEVQRSALPFIMLIDRLHTNENPLRPLANSISCCSKNVVQLIKTSLVKLTAGRIMFPLNSGAGFSLVPRCLPRMSWHPSTIISEQKSPLTNDSGLALGFLSYHMMLLESEGTGEVCSLRGQTRCQAF